MLQMIIIWLFQLILFTVPLFFATNTDELFEFNKMILTYFLTICLVTCWAIRMIVEKRIIFKRTPFDIPIALFLGSQILSTLFSIHPQTSWLGYYSRFHGGLLSIISYTALYYTFVNNIDRKDLPKLFFSLFSAAFLVGIYAIFEHFGHSPSCLLITGTFDAHCWIQDVQHRVFASFGQPNWLAAYAVTILPLAGTLAIYSRRKIETFLYYSATFSLLLALVFTKSRSGILGLAFGLVLLIFGYLIRLYVEKKFSKTSNKSVFFLLGSSLAIVLVFGTPYTPSLQQISSNQKEIETTQNSDNGSINRLEIGGTESGEIRKIVWSGAIDVWKRYPILGSGVETFAYSYYRDRPMSHNMVSEWDFLYNKAHNEYLNFLATTGLVGLSCYLIFQVWYTLFSVKQLLTSKITTEKKNILLALLSGYAALSVSNFFGFSTVMVGILFFLFPAILVVLLQEETLPSAKKLASIKSSETTSTYVGISVVSIIALISLFQVINYWRADVLFTRSKAYLGASEYQEGFNLLQQAMQKNPEEALYIDTLADTYAQVAVQLVTQDATAATEVANAAIVLSNKTLALNPAHLNFYKTQIRIYLTLASLDERYLQSAETSARTALEHAPTDAKLQFTLAQILKAQGKTSEALEAFEKTVSMKSNYEAAYQELARFYLELNQPVKAAEAAQYILTNLNPKNVIALQIATYSGQKN